MAKYDSKSSEIFSEETIAINSKQLSSQKLISNFFSFGYLSLINGN